MLNKKIIVSDVNEAGCYGAALLARSAMEMTPAEQLFKTRKTENEIFSPDPEIAKFYDKKFETYKQLYPVLKQFW